ncbi:MAG TPA: aminoimidazole riboside kinase [Bacillales bacterium]|nr:aminoimidazole riboside kinase [Bacillales bacterium]
MERGIICLGEALIDFIPKNATNLVYEKCPGGAPANVAVGLAKLGVDTTFLGKVGDDVLGRFLKQTLKDYKVDVSQMVLSSEAKTGLTFVTLDKNGERSFDFYIEPRADQLLREDELEKGLFEKQRILHFGSISLIHEPSRGATKQAIRLAKQEGLKLSFDPNIRMSLWENEQQARETILEVLPNVDILKISEEELAFITGKRDIEEGILACSEFEIPLIFVTCGAEGSIVFSEKASLSVPAMKIEAVDTTGAGDAYVSGMLFGLSQVEGELRSITEKEMERVGQFASVSGALAASQKGAMTALPELSEVKEFLE